MTKEKIQVVAEVKEVVCSIQKKVQQGKDITLEDFNELSFILGKLIADYQATVENYLVANSLAVKYEKFLEVVGIIEYYAVEDTALLDETTNRLVNIAESIKHKNS